MDGPRGTGDGEECPTSDAGAATPQILKPGFQANENFLKVLVSMGITQKIAEKALYATGNQSADLAAAWVFENQEADSDGSEVGEGLYKMVFVVNASLGMGPGKVGAQVAHAALSLHRLLLREQDEYADMMLDWQEHGETKIVLRGNDDYQLITLEREAQSLGLPACLIKDAGRTQIPAGSTTVLGIMGRIDLVDKVTGSLRLL